MKSKIIVLALFFIPLTSRADVCQTSVTCRGGNKISCSANGFKTRCGHNQHAIFCTGWDANGTSNESLYDCDANSQIDPLAEVKGLQGPCRMTDYVRDLCH